MPDPKDQPKADTTVVGGPDAPAPQPAPQAEAPRLVPIKYGDQEIHVPETAAQAWTAREQEFSRKLSEHSAELGELRKFRQSVQQTVTPEPKRPELGQLLFEDPNRAIAEIQRGIVEQVRQEYRQDQTQQRFWSGFYSKHDDLMGEDTLVEAVMRKHWAELEPLPVETAKDKLADLSRSEILRIAKKLKGGNGADQPLPQDRAVVEGSSSRVPKPVPKAEEPKSLSDVIRDRRAKRLNPQAPKG